ncbi:hypothetical protein [Stutzerimonas stutzeri]|jgi:hypothetical protein|uniref:Uncharacterized protein n=1 Tax=Stutzerimonas stutzeri RCH2 TaxID=644801 RepID=L0GPD2_STUST|nr:hypothetical protein [Stutzerimonas stutzeri]AGA87647.1 hypothetical protein Psest_3151 [Stutzerimonas stutzeri RCH2]
MKEHVQQPKFINEQELDARIEKAQSAYKNSHAACSRVNEGILPIYTKRVLEFVAQGYTFAEHLPCSAHPGSYTAYMLKPEHIQQEELNTIAVDVKEKYLADIEDYNKHQENLLTEQLYQAEKRKQEEAERKKEEALRKKAAQEAKEYFQSIQQEAK